MYGFSLTGMIDLSESILSYSLSNSSQAKSIISEEIFGNVDFTWGGDWYSDEMEIHYIPYSVKSGTVEFKYTFIEI